MTVKIATALVLAGLGALALTGGALGQTNSSPPSPPLTDAAFDQSFQCPEVLADDKARRIALVDYFHWASARHPDWSVAQAVEFKKQLLIHHQCATSLRDLADYAKTEQSDQMAQFLCQRIDPRANP
ncbi:MAG TPA: hypothetical protein VHY34_08915 [Caulobacteraceae bacterium]|jgi:hypothetical protein|nr:hypothetical protein [Caulobacteraceae bacterium]